MKFLYFLLAFVPFTGFAQAEKDSLLLANYESVKEKLELMQYLDQKANGLYKQDAAAMAKIDKDFAGFYRDSVLAGNPTRLDISAYLGYKPGKQPKSLERFQEEAFSANLDMLLSLTKTYGYLCGQRINKLKPDGKLISGLICTQRIKGYEKRLRKLFDTEYKIGNMPEGEYVFFDTMANCNGVLTNADIERMDKAGMKMFK